MADIQTNVDQLNADMVALKQAINETGVEVPDGTPLKDLPEKVQEVYEKGVEEGASSIDTSGFLTKPATPPAKISFIAIDTDNSQKQVSIGRGLYYSPTSNVLTANSANEYHIQTRADEPVGANNFPLAVRYALTQHSAFGKWDEGGVDYKAIARETLGATKLYRHTISIYKNFSDEFGDGLFNLDLYLVGWNASPEVFTLETLLTGEGGFQGDLNFLVGSVRYSSLEVPGKDYQLLHEPYWASLYENICYIVGFGYDYYSSTTTDFGIYFDGSTANSYEFSFNDTVTEL